MTVFKTLNRAILIEQKFSECYYLLSRSAPEPALADDLKKLAQEETYHANLIRTGMNMVSKIPELVKETRLSWADIDRGLAMLNEIIQALKEQKSEFPTALKKLYDLEMVFEEVHMNKVAEFDDPSLKQLFQALAEGDQDHRERLDRILKSQAG